MGFWKFGHSFHGSHFAQYLLEYTVYTTFTAFSTGYLGRNTHSSVSNGSSLLWHLYQFVKKPATSAPRPTHPPAERGTRSVTPINSNDGARWLALADVALRMGATEVVVGETETLARKEQADIKKRIRRTVQQVRGQSKSKQ